jgi:hypothetical protein
LSACANSSRRSNRSIYPSTHPNRGPQRKLTFVLLKCGRKLALASLLVKHGFSVRDAWVSDGLNKGDADEFMEKIAHELASFDATLDIVQAATAHGLAINLEQGEAPPFGLVQFLEAIGLAQVRPE